MTSMVATPPVALTIAGSDSSGGAGIQADLKTFSALGAYGTSVITAVTAQNTCQVTAVHAVPESVVAEQFRAVVDDIRLDAVKIGMLANAALTHTVAELLDDPRLDAIPVILDPVMVATSGSRLLADDAIHALSALIRRADLITPNLAEAAALTGQRHARTITELADQALALRDLGAKRVLVKGGHRDDQDMATDLLLDADGTQTLLTSPRVATTNTHGTGCTLSSAIAALRPRQSTWIDTVRAAKDWLTAALQHADQLAVGRGHGPVHHFHELARWQ